eukprot:7385311-Prymnesium_polylepis.1
MEFIHRSGEPIHTLETGSKFRHGNWHGASKLRFGVVENADMATLVSGSPCTRQTLSDTCRRPLP